MAASGKKILSCVLAHFDVGGLLDGAVTVMLSVLVILIGLALSI